MNEQLIFDRHLKDGRVLAINVWANGWQKLVYQDWLAFCRAKVATEERGEIPQPVGFTET